MNKVVFAAILVLVTVPLSASAQDAHDRMLPSADALRSVDDPSFKDSTAYGTPGYMGNSMQSGRSSYQVPHHETRPAKLR